MIPDILSNKKHKPIVTEIFIGGRELNISLTSITYKIPTPTGNEEFELLDGKCSVSDIQNYFEYII